MYGIISLISLYLMENSKYFSVLYVALQKINFYHIFPEEHKKVIFLISSMTRTISRHPVFAVFYM
jgi:hypothetical protein